MNVEATVLFLRDPSAQTCDTNVSSDLFSPNGSGVYPWNQLIYRCSTPVSGRSKYYEVYSRGDHGTSTSVGSGYLEDTSKNWSTNQWIPPNGGEWMRMISSTGYMYDITSHTATRLNLSVVTGGCDVGINGPATPASGTYLITGQHDSWQTYYWPSGNPTLYSGSKYYYGAFVRHDNVDGYPVWHDNRNGTESYPASADKYLELVAPGMRTFIMMGFNGTVACANGVCQNKYSSTASEYASTCSGCSYDVQFGTHNVSPYTGGIGYLMDYNKWYAVVLGLTPSHGSTADGRIEFWINGIKVIDRSSIKTQDATDPVLEHISWSGTHAQGCYDARAHYRKFDYVILTDTLSDITNAGLMSDPEAGEELDNGMSPHHFITGTGGTHKVGAGNAFHLK